MRKIPMILMLLCGSVSGLFAQKAPVKFGKVDPEVVSETHFAADSTASAAVLCEYGVFDTRDFTFTTILRYKVYTKEGLNSLILSLPVEQKSYIQGYVYNMKDGKVESSKLENEHIYSERIIGRYTRMRVAPPAAREGSVVELRYTMQGLPMQWNFQRKIPVLHSEIRIPFSEYYTFNQRFIGYIPLSEVKPGRWVARDMPAFKPEPFINSASNYMTTMFLELSEVHIPGNIRYMSYHEQVSTSWEAVAEYIYEHKKFGEVFRNPAPYLNDIADQLMNAYPTEEERVKRALKIVQNVVKWDKTDRLFPSPSLREIYMKERTGNSTDMNFLFLRLLRKMNVECYPLLMSTREYGTINPMFPSYSRFSYTASYVKIGNGFRVIDASDKHFSVDLLSRKCLNGCGFVIRKEGGEWIDIVPEKSSNQIINCDLVVSNEGVLEGSITRQLADYGSAIYREEREEFTTEDEYLVDFEKKNPGVYIMDYQVEGLDKNCGPVTEKMKVEIDGKAQSSGGLFYLAPVILSGVEENPFKLESREYPVDFAHGKNDIYVLNLKVPQGFVTQQLPEPIRLVNTDKSASFTYSVTQDGNIIRILYSLGINKPVFLPGEYSELRALYDIVVNKGSEPIILKRAEP